MKIVYNKLNIDNVSNIFKVPQGGVKASSDWPCTRIGLIRLSQLALFFPMVPFDTPENIT